MRQSEFFSWKDRFFVFVLFVIFLISTSFLIMKFYNYNTVAIPQDGGVFQFEIVGAPKRVISIFKDSTNVDKYLTKLMFQGIYRYNFVNEAYEPDLIKNVVVDDSKKIYTFYIKKESKWHDGTPVTATDVIFSYNDIYQQNFTFNRIDDSIFQVVLIQPDVFLKEKLTKPVLPSHILKGANRDNLIEQDFMRKPFGSGPFKLVSISPTQAKLTRFEDFSGNKPYLNTVVINFYNDFDEVKMTESKNILEIPDGKLAKVRQPKKFRMHEIMQPKFTAMFFNMDRPVFKHKMLRMGVANLVERHELIEAIPSSSIQSLIPQASSSSALKMINEVGYKNNGGKLLTRQTGNRFEYLSFNLVTPKVNEFPKVAKVIKDGLFKYGVICNIIELNENDFLEALKARNYDAIITGVDAGMERDLFAFLHSSQVTYPGKNLSNYNNKDLDLLMEKLHQEEDIGSRVKLNTQIDEVIKQDIPFLPLYTKTMFVALDPAIKGVTASNISDISDLMLDLRTWYIKEKRVWK